MYLITAIVAGALIGALLAATSEEECNEQPKPKKSKRNIKTKK